MDYVLPMNSSTAGLRGGRKSSVSIKKVCCARVFRFRPSAWRCCWALRIMVQAGKFLDRSFIYPASDSQHRAFRVLSWDWNFALLAEWRFWAAATWSKTFRNWFSGVVG